MGMTNVDVKSTFLRMPPKSQMRTLSLLAHNLTVCARAAYAQDVNDALARKQHHAANELLHTITAQLMHLIADDANRYPDDVFIDILLEKAQTESYEKELLGAFIRALSTK
jgi:hypothetical protein